MKITLDDKQFEVKWDFGDLPDNNNQNLTIDMLNRWQEYINYDKLNEARKEARKLRIDKLNEINSNSNDNKIL